MQRIAHLAATAEDADRVLCALTNLEALARESANPERDVREIEAWRVEAEDRVARLRGRRPTVQMHAGAVMKRRVPA